MNKILVWANDKPPGRYMPYTKSDTGAKIQKNTIQLDTDLILQFDQIEYFGYQFRTLYFQPKKTSTSLPKHIYISGKDDDLYKLALELQSAGLKTKYPITKSGRKIFIKNIAVLLCGLILLCAAIVVAVVLFSK